MFCNKCGAQLPPESSFCNKCGAAIVPVGAGGAMAPPAPGGREPEEDLWRGRPSAKAYGHWVLLWLLWAGLLGFVWLSVLSAEMRARAVAQAVVAAAAGLPLLLLGWKIAVAKLSTRYRLTNYRLFREVGILSRHMNELELVRVDDVSVRQNLIQRIFNVGVITVISPTDQTEPRLELDGIEDPIEVKEKIRSHVRKRRERSLHVESL